MDMTSRPSDDFLRFGQMLGALPSFMNKDAEQLEKVDEVRQNFLKFTTRYQNNPIKFFQDECKKFTTVASKLLKKIIKLYAMAKDDDQVNESIQNWDLHLKLMEKKYGKRKIQTKYLYK
jgi:hypothetical protein